jgi:hypothetical protein
LVGEQVLSATAAEIGRAQALGQRLGAQPNLTAATNYLDLWRVSVGAESG